MGVAPVLALLIATILRYSDSGQYDFASAYHIPTFLFLSLIVAMFLGLTNSADDVIRDRAVLQRERNLNVRLSYYVVSKTITLGVFALIQCILFVLIGNYILQIRGMFWIDLGIVFMDEFDDKEIAALLRLKRYEQPPPGYFENFLHEFHRRQRDELLKQPLWRILMERAHARTKSDAAGRTVSSRLHLCPHLQATIEEEYAGCATCHCGTITGIRCRVAGCGND